MTDILPGTLAMLVLKTLTVQPMHGYGIAQELQRRSQDVIRVEEGSLYPALHRMEQDGWVRAEWGTTEKNRQARFYSLTAAGRKQLTVETGRWNRLVESIARVLDPGPTPEQA